MEPQTTVSMNQVPKRNAPGRSKAFTVILVLILILIMGYLLWMERNNQAGDVVTIAPGQELVTAKEGNVISNFPAGLILEQDAVVSQSYSVSYVNDDLSQPVVEYTSKKNLAENIQMFKEYLTANGWSITHEASIAETPVTFFYAKKEKEQVNITFAPQADGALKINIAYVTQSL